MKLRITLLLILIALLLLSAGGEAWSAPPRYRIDTGTLPGETLQLVHTSAQASAISEGGAYRLSTRSASSTQASGCCCTWLPCVRNQY